MKSVKLLSFLVVVAALLTVVSCRAKKSSHSRGRKTVGDQGHRDRRGTVRRPLSGRSRCHEVREVGGAPASRSRSSSGLDLVTPTKSGAFILGQDDQRVLLTAPNATAPQATRLHQGRWVSQCVTNRHRSATVGCAAYHNDVTLDDRCSSARHQDHRPWGGRAACGAIRGESLSSVNKVIADAASKRRGQCGQGQERPLLCCRSRKYGTLAKRLQ
jgi:hypothetical protein